MILPCTFSNASHSIASGIFFLAGHWEQAWRESNKAITQHYRPFRLLSPLITSVEANYIMSFHVSVIQYYSGVLHMLSRSNQSQWIPKEVQALLHYLQLLAVFLILLSITNSDNKAVMNVSYLALIMLIKIVIKSQLAGLHTFKVHFVFWVMS